MMLQDATEIACPQCHAGIGEACRLMHRAYTHPARWAAWLSDPLTWKRHLNQPRANDEKVLRWLTRRKETQC